MKINGRSTGKILTDMSGSGRLLWQRRMILVPRALQARCSTDLRNTFKGSPSEHTEKKEMKFRNMEYKNIYR